MSAKPKLSTSTVDESEHVAAQDAVEEAPSSSRTFREASTEVVALVGSVMREHFDQLVQAGVTVRTIMAHAGVDDDGEPKGPAIQKDGHAVAGRTKIVSLKDRVAGLDDAVMELDGDRWPEWQEMFQRSVIWHELNHLELKGKIDDAGRPKMKLRKHDIQLGVFLAGMEIFGSEGADTQVMAQAAGDSKEWIQPLMEGWG